MHTPFVAIKKKCISFNIESYHFIRSLLGVVCTDGVPERTASLRLSRFASNWFSFAITDIVFISMGFEKNIFQCIIQAFWLYENVTIYFFTTPAFSRGILKT